MAKVRHVHMGWNQRLTFAITPKSGPLRPLATLLDASQALMQDLTLADRRKPHWRDAGWAVVAAADDDYAVRRATEALVEALDAEGWMTPAKPPQAEEALGACLGSLSAALSECMAAAKPRGKPALRLVGGTDGGGAPASRPLPPAPTLSTFIAPRVRQAG